MVKKDDKDREKQVVEIQEFRIEDLPYSFTMIVVAPPASGKTEFMLNIAYVLRHRYPVAKCFIGSFDAYSRCCKIFGDMYVSCEWNEEEEKQHINRQKCCNRDYGKGFKGNYAINILDDISDDPKIFHTKTMRGLFKIGSQHWSQALLLGTQYSVDMPPDVRKSASYIVLGREPNFDERKKLYNNFGGITGSFNRFNDLMDQITGDYTFLVLKNRSQSNNLEDCVFWYRTMDLTKVKWEFGCAEYKKFNKDRYDPNFIEEF